MNATAGHLKRTSRNHLTVADLCEELGLSVPPLPEDVERKITEKAPDIEEPSQLSGETITMDLKTHTVHVQRGPQRPVEIRTLIRPKSQAGKANGNPNR